MENCTSETSDVPHKHNMKRNMDSNVQTRVLGWRHGKWGKRMYPGIMPTKTDLLDWHVKHITELRRQILDEQEKCKKRPGPTAFVTFK